MFRYWHDMLRHFDVYAIDFRCMLIAAFAADTMLPLIYARYLDAYVALPCLICCARRQHATPLRATLIDADAADAISLSFSCRWLMLRNAIIFITFIADISPRLPAYFGRCCHYDAADFRCHA